MPKYKSNEWNLLFWYCMNCGVKMSGYLGKKNEINTQCPNCRVIIKRKVITDTEDIFKVKYPV